MGVSWNEARATMLGGMTLGLAIAFAPALPGIGWSEAEQMPAGEPPARAIDPYAEGRRSREILKAQEGAPRPINATAAGRGVQATAGDGDQVEVIDGDTFRYAGQTIRIADIDTPEVRGRCAYESALAARATARMAQLLRKGPFELSPVERETDRYGRKLRVVTRAGRSLGDQLVAEGLARTWTGRREPWC